MRNLALNALVLINLVVSSQSWGVEIEVAAELEELFNTAQVAYFKETDSAQAIIEFEKVANLANVANWSKSQKKLIHFSMLRLAQLSKSEDNARNWITKSYNFAPELEPDTEIFPPPIVEKYADLTRLQPQRDITIREPSLKRALVVPTEPNPEFDASTTLPKPLEENPVWKNKWLWIGVGTLAAGYIIYENNRDEPQHASPRTTYGF